MHIEYKFQPAYLDERMSEVVDELDGRAPLDTFVAQTEKLVSKKGGYLKFGPYWFAVKRILNIRSTGRTFGQYTNQWLAETYSEMNPNGTVNEARTLLAAWEFYEDSMESDVRTQNGIAAIEREYEIAGNVYPTNDPDMEGL